MGRLVAILLGGAALAFYVPALLAAHLDGIEPVVDLWKKILPGTWYSTVYASGGGIFAGLALVLLAVRGKE